MALEANSEGCYVVTCGDRFEAGVALGRAVVTYEVGAINVTESYDPNTVSLKHASEILSDPIWVLTAETRGEPVVIWPMADWGNYARSQFILPEQV